MICVPEVVVERVAGAVGSERRDNSGVARPEAISATGFASRRTVAEGETLLDLSVRAARRALSNVSPDCVCGVVAATFSDDVRFPQLSARVADAVGLSNGVMALDLKMACSAYPYALYVAGRMAADAGGKVLVIDGDVQSRLCDQGDVATAPLFSDASTASVVSASPDAESRFDFLTRPSDALSCADSGPIKMDGFKVFSFVASDVVGFLRRFGDGFDCFVPHQANMYMVRQLARSLSLEDRLVTCGEEFANPGSCSVPLALAVRGVKGRVLVAGFGAGLSAAAGIIRVADGASAGVEAL